MTASSDTRSRDKALMAAIVALGMMAEGSQKQDGRSHGWPQLPEEQSRLSGHCRCAGVTSTARRQGLERTTAGQEMSQRKATLETTAILVLLHK